MGEYIGAVRVANASVFFLENPAYISQALGFVEGSLPLRSYPILFDT
jgi:hypothetical protein